MSDELSVVEPFRTPQDNLRISLFASKHKISINDVEKLLAKKDVEMSDALDNLKFAYALSEKNAENLKARVELLEEALNHALIRHCNMNVLGPDSRCTPDWFVELSAIQCGIQKTELKCQLEL